MLCVFLNRQSACWLVKWIVLLTMGENQSSLDYLFAFQFTYFRKFLFVNVSHIYQSIFTSLFRELPADITTITQSITTTTLILSKSWQYVCFVFLTKVTSQDWSMSAYLTWGRHTSAAHNWDCDLVLFCMSISSRTDVTKAGNPFVVALKIVEIVFCGLASKYEWLIWLQ